MVTSDILLGTEIYDKPSVTLEIVKTIVATGWNFFSLLNW